MALWLKAAVLAGLFYYDSTPFPESVPSGCTRLSRRVYECEEAPGSECTAPFTGSARNEDTCAVDAFSKTFDLSGVDRMMIDSSKSAEIEVQYSIVAHNVTNQALPIAPETLPNNCTDMTGIRYVKNNDTSMWLICYDESSGEIIVHFGTVSGVSGTWQMLFHIQWVLSDFKIQQMKLARADTINGLLALRLDYSIEFNFICDGVVDSSSTPCDKFSRDGSKVATNNVFLCSDQRCSIAYAKKIQRPINEIAYVPVFDQMTPGSFQNFTQSTWVGFDENVPFLFHMASMIESVRRKTLVFDADDYILLDWTFPVQITFSLYNGGIWLSYLDGFNIQLGRFGSELGALHARNLMCSNPTNCPALDEDGPTKEYFTFECSALQFAGGTTPCVVSENVPVKYYSNDGYDKIVLSTACIDTVPGGCANLAAFSVSETASAKQPTFGTLSDDGGVFFPDISMTLWVLSGPVKTLNYDRKEYFFNDGVVGIDFSQRMTFEVEPSFVSRACWVRTVGASVKGLHMWTGIIFTGYTGYEPLGFSSGPLDIQDGLGNLVSSINQRALDGVLVTSVRNTGATFQLEPFEYSDPESIWWSNHVNLSLNDPVVGSFMLHTVSVSDMVLVSTSNNPGIGGNIQAYYEHQLESGVVYLVVNDTHALFGTSKGPTFSRSTSPTTICMVKHADEARVVRIFTDITNVIEVESITFSDTGDVTVKSGTTSEPYSSSFGLLCNQDDVDGQQSRSTTFDLWIYKTPIPLSAGFAADLAIVTYNTTETEGIIDVMNEYHFVAPPLDLVQGSVATIESLVFRSLPGDVQIEIFVALVQTGTDWSLVYNIATEKSGNAYSESPLTGASQCTGLTLVFLSQNIGSHATVLCKVHANLVTDDVLFVLNVATGTLHNYTQAGDTLTYGTMTLRKNNLYLPLFNNTAVSIVQVFLETGNFTQSFEGTDSSVDVVFPVPAQLEFGFKGVNGTNHGSSILSDIATKSRLAVEPTASLQLYVDIGAASMLNMYLNVLALDNPDLAQFYFFHSDTSTNGTALLTNGDGKYESNVMNLFGDGNIKWQGCPGQNLQDGVPFLTSLGTAACSLDIEILDRFDTNAANLLTRYRLGVEFDTEVMLCWGAGNVTLGQPCGAHPVVHGSTTDCAVAEGGTVDPFVCAADDEIFSFNAVAHTVTTQCISFSGTCANERFHTATSSNHGFSECQHECASDATCFFFEHGDTQGCRRFTRNSTNEQSFFAACPAGMLGFLCRNQGKSGLLTTSVVLDPAGTPAFYTDISSGNNVEHRIVHGNSSAATMKIDDRGADRNFLLQFDSNGVNVTGGTVAYVCGQTPAFSANHTDTTVLFTHPASEDDAFQNTTIQQCYHSTHQLTPHERQTMDAPVQNTLSCTSLSAVESFYAKGFDEASGNPYLFYNTYTPANLTVADKPSITSTSASGTLAVPSFSIAYDSPLSTNNLNFGPLPGDALETVAAMNDPPQYPPADSRLQSQWSKMSMVPTEQAPHDIRPVRLETVDRASSNTDYGANKSSPVDPAVDLAQFRIGNLNGLKISDVFWGRHNNFKAYFHQLSNKKALSNETDTLAKYIFSMTEAVSSDLCPNTTVPCVLGRLTAPAMNPLFSDAVTVHGRKFAVGFTPYRIAPFAGVFLESGGNNNQSDSGDNAMVMPDDGFILEHGGVGYGAASSCVDNETVYSFGGLDYSPNSTYRQFELLPFDMPRPLRWQPVWHRQSTAFGCATEEETCTHQFEENVLPQGDKANINSRFESILHATAHTQAKNAFFHYAAKRIINSTNPPLGTKCGAGDYSINTKMLFDDDTHEDPSHACSDKSYGTVFRMNMPLTTYNVDFSRTTPNLYSTPAFEGESSFNSPLNAFLSTPDLNGENLFSAYRIFSGNLFSHLAYMQCRKVPVYLNLWQSLLSMNEFNVENYKLLDDDVIMWMKACKSSRNPHIEQHYNSAGSDKYHKCYPGSSGSAKILYTEAFRGDNAGDNIENGTGANSKYPPKPPQDCGNDKWGPGELYASLPNASGYSLTLNGDEDLLSAAPTYDQTFWTYAGSTLQKFLINISYVAPDIFMLNRECLMGEMALIKLIAFFDDANSTQFRKSRVFTQSKEASLAKFDLANVFSSAFFKEGYDAVSPTMYMHKSNLRTQELCYIRNLKAVVNYDTNFLRYCSMQAKPGYQQNMTVNMGAGDWPTIPGKFYFPLRGDKEVPESAAGPTCGVKMCVSPFPALLPPFQRNCDLLSPYQKPDTSSEWRKCPMMPNPEWYRANISADANAAFFSRQVWRLPAFWHNREGVWNAKAYRFDMDQYDKNPQPVKKIFKTVVHPDRTATASVIGELNCARVGAVVQQSTLSPSQYYVCGGITGSQLSEGCSLCELASVDHGKSANIKMEFDPDCANDAIIVGRELKQNSVELGLLEVDWVCENSEVDDRTGVPLVMQRINKVRTESTTEITRTFFQPALLVMQQGNAVAIPPVGMRFDARSYSAPVSICYVSTNAAARATFVASNSQTPIRVDATGSTLTATSGTTTKTVHVSEGESVCFDANGLSQSNGPSRAFWSQKRVPDGQEVTVDLDVQTKEDAAFSFSTKDHSTLIRSDMNETDAFSANGVRWRVKAGYFETPELPVKWACVNATTTPVCNSSVDCSADQCISRYYDNVTDAVMAETASNIAKGLYEHIGFLKPADDIKCVSAALYKAYPLNFTLQENVFGYEDCSANLGNKSMVLIQRSAEARLGMPHFVEAAPQMIVRTAEACSAASTQCHTFHESNDPGVESTKLCFHGVGCSAQEFVNVDNATAEPPTFTCTSFEKCTQKDIGKYTELGTHAGVRPQCQLVRACAEPGYYRHHTSFETELGPIQLGACHEAQPCDTSAAFEASASTAFRDSQCLEFSSCTSAQYESVAPSPNADRQCIQITSCESVGLNESVPATPTSDAVCINISIQCPYPNQFFSRDDGGCRDAKICGIRQRITQEKTVETDRQCIDLQECSFYEIEVPGLGLTTECLPTTHASETEEIAMMAAGGTVGALACLLRLIFNPSAK